MIRSFARRAATLLFGLAVGSLSGHAAQIHVSPRGNDAAAGSVTAPFATLEKARQAARSALAAGESVEVILHGGTYELSAPLEFSVEDSGRIGHPAIWRAAEDEEARISGGRRISGWRKVSNDAVLARLDPAVRDRVWEIDLRSQGITDYGEMSGGFALPSDSGIELFIGDVPAHVARYPNKGFIKIAEVLGKTPVDVRGTIGAKEGIFRVEDARIAKWTGEKDPRAMGFWFWDWAEQHQKITSVDPKGLVIELAQPWQDTGYRKGQYFYGYNLLCEIDEPGEWVLDREAGVLYLLPEGDQAPESVAVTMLPAIVRIKGTSHLQWKGVIFELARGDAVTLSSCDSVEIADSTLRNCGKWAVRIDGGKECRVTGCEISQTGDGGVSLSGGDRATLLPAGHEVRSCHIHDYSRWTRTYQPAIRLSGVGNRAIGNLIHDAPHQAMQFEGNLHLIEYNEIHNVCEETNDAGAIYAWNDWAGRGNVIRYNYLHHIYGLDGKGAAGVYLDDAFSNAEIRGNVFETVFHPLLLGGGRDHLVTENLFVDCIEAIHIDARGLHWRAFGLDELKAKLETVPYAKPPWSEKFPELTKLLADEPMAPKGIVVSRNIAVDSSWNAIEEKAKPFVTLRDNLFNAPRSILVNGKSGLPEVNAENPEAKAIGFPSLPYDRIGLGRPAEHPVKPQSWAPEIQARLQPSR